MYVSTLEEHAQVLIIRIRGYIFHGNIKEKSSYSNGDLIVTKDSWRISYYFAGPDLRHNGTFFSIEGKN